jgi:hypothetical protein
MRCDGILDASRSKDADESRKTAIQRGQRGHRHGPRTTWSSQYFGRVVCLVTLAIMPVSRAIRKLRP